MSLVREHDLHKKRRSRNAAVALLLVSLIGIVLGLTLVKVTSGGFEAVVTSQEGR
ncbi:MAG: cytochrome C oxidase assembly protein [Marinovum sp.]|nr:cytochrome C oxidase assembly protein [Marinovum sp.]